MRAHVFSCYLKKSEFSAFERSYHWLQLIWEFWFLTNAVQVKTVILQNYNSSLMSRNLQKLLFYTFNVLLLKPSSCNKAVKCIQVNLTIFYMVMHVMHYSSLIREKKTFVNTHFSSLCDSWCETMTTSLYQGQNACWSYILYGISEWAMLSQLGSAC